MNRGKLIALLHSKSNILVHLVEDINTVVVSLHLSAAMSGVFNAYKDCPLKMLISCTNIEHR